MVECIKRYIIYIFVNSDNFTGFTTEESFVLDQNVILSFEI